MIAADPDSAPVQTEPAASSANPDDAKMAAAEQLQRAMSGGAAPSDKAIRAALASLREAGMIGPEA
jgi:hypothetical protein